MTQQNYKIDKIVGGKKKSKIKKYQELIIGSSGIASLIKYELVILLSSWIPGALGIFLRGKLFPLVLGKVGRGVVFGSNIVIRHPKKISIGDNVIIDDNVMLDAKGENNEGIKIESDVYVGRNSILSCKGGNIILKKRANVGFNCEVFSSNNVEIGSDTLIAAYSYIMGGGSYKLENSKIPINKQYDYEGKGGVKIEENVWLGTHSVVMDGITIGSGSVIAAGGVVTKDIPLNTIAAGMPAKIIRER